MAIAWCQATGIDAKIMKDVLADTKAVRRRGILSRRGSGIRSISKIRINEVSECSYKQAGKTEITGLSKELWHILKKYILCTTGPLTAVWCNRDHVGRFTPGLFWRF